MINIKLIGVTKRFGTITAVDNINLDIERGELFTILGPTGAGKTTTLKLIAGLLKPDEGEIYFDGQLVNDVPPEERDIGFVFQGYALFPHMTVWENVTYGPLVRGMDPEKVERIGREILSKVHLLERADSYPRELSGGMQQRVALARALASGSKLLLLDEPLSALDARLREELRFELRNIVKEAGATAIQVTHDKYEALQLSDRIAILRKGKVVQVDTPVNLFTKPNSIFVANFICDMNFFEGIVKKVDEEGSIIELRGGPLVKTLDRTHRVGERVVVAVRFEDVEIKPGETRRPYAIYGKVERISFLGPFIRIEVLLDNGEEVSVKLPATIGYKFELRDRVTTFFEPTKTIVYSYPRAGLAEELIVE